MDAEQLWETTMDPEKRILRRVVMDEEEASEIDVTFNTLMEMCIRDRTLLAIGKENPKVVGVSCDSAKGGGMWSFVEAFPERYVEMGISEQNAIGVARCV